MKYFIAAICVSFFVTSCKNEKAKLVGKTYINSLISHYTPSQLASDNEKNIQFWKARINPKNPGQVSESRYASTLITRFHEFGDIEDVKAAEAVLNSINKTYNNSLGSPFAALTSSAILQHHFSRADTLLQKAKKIGIETNSAITLSFDVDFELGRMQNCKFYLKQLGKVKNYNYYFRESKVAHFNGALDSAVNNMLAAANWAKSSAYLQDIALSNAADLYVHAGKLENAVDLYKKCIRLNSNDFHSILGLGWIALVHDKNDTLAERIFKFVLTKNKLPDPLFKLYQMAQLRGDKVLEERYAHEFVTRSTDTVYGKMYNKYIIEILTGVLNQPAKAEELAKHELNNRATPQTYAWYAYTLFVNHKNDEAYKVFEQYVSGQPLEGLELYYMGKLMKGVGKGYNSGEFFKAAQLNQYDLSPAMKTDLEKNLEE